MAMQPNYDAEMTVEEYFKLDESSDIKYEYLDGEIYAMSGGTFEHSRIIHNLNGLMFNALRGSNCRGNNSDIRVEVTKSHYVYPDFTVVCGEPEFNEEKPNNLTNPTMVVEVISDSSEDRDRYTKFNLYRSIPSLKIYLIIEQKRASATLYVRHEDGWFLRFYNGLEAVIPLNDIHAELKLSELYETIEFPDAEPDDF